MHRPSVPGARRGAWDEIGSAKESELAPLSYIDPSGLVQTTRGVRLAGATSPKRGVTASGRQVRVPAGSAVMSSGSRRNPDLTGPLGTFGWDVLPGYDTITASRSRCRSPTAGRTARRAVHEVLPAVDDLVLILRCPCLSRRVTRMRLSVLREEYSAFGLTGRLTARGSPRPFLGVVTIKPRLADAGDDGA